MGLKIDARRRRILEIVNEKGQVSVSDLAAALDTTVVTIRTDLKEMDAGGISSRVPGGAIQAVPNFHNRAFQQRQKHNEHLKKMVARETGCLVEDGDTLLINSGTTTYYTAIELRKRKNLYVVTNSLSVAMELGDVPNFRLILLGGEINTQYSFTYGSTALEQLRLFKADKAILSMDGVHAQAGLTTLHAEEAVLNRTMMDRAKETIVAADHTKLGRESFSFVADLAHLSCLVTTPGAKELDSILNAGVRVITSKDE